MGGDYECTPSMDKISCMIMRHALRFSTIRRQIHNIGISAIWYRLEMNLSYSANPIVIYWCIGISLDQQCRFQSIRGRESCVYSKNRWEFLFILDSTSNSVLIGDDVAFCESNLPAFYDMSPPQMRVTESDCSIVGILWMLWSILDCPGQLNYVSSKYSEGWSV